MRLPHRLQGQKVKSQSHGAGAYCGGHLTAQLVIYIFIRHNMTESNKQKEQQKEQEKKEKQQQLLYKLRTFTYDIYCWSAEG